jgi:hypothetical protein
MTDKQQPPEIPERLFAKACHPERPPNHNCSWSFSKEPVEGSVPYARVHPVDNARDVITFTALIEVLKRLRSKNRNPDREWYEGWNAAIDCLIHDAESRTAVPSSERRCGECGHYNFNPNSGLCVEWVDRKQQRCSCKCVFPATGALTNEQREKYARMVFDNCYCEGATHKETCSLYLAATSAGEADATPIPTSAAVAAAREWMNIHHASLETNQKREEALAVIISRHFPSTATAEIDR